MIAVNQGMQHFHRRWEQIRFIFYRRNGMPWTTFVHGIPALTQRQWRLLGLVALALMFGQYAVVLLPLALPQIQTSLGLSAAQMSQVSALIQLGALPAFAFTWAADHVGRRRVLLLAVITFILLTGATAFAQTVALFTLLQCLVRTFVTAASLLAGVMVVEEFPEEARGWGIGALSALTSVGGGAAAVLFAVVHYLPFGWRALYLISWLALLSLGLLAKELHETTRFQTQRPPSQAGNLFLPWQRLLSTYPGRFAALGASIFLVSLGSAPALFYDLAYLQQAHGWQPWHIALLNLGAGFMALLGSAYAGHLSDQIGRKKVISLFLLSLTALVIAYFRGQGWPLPLLWAGLLFTSIGASVALGTLRVELFPTAYRATATGAMAVVATLGGALGLALHSRLIRFSGSPWTAIGWLALLLLMAPLFTLPLPETRGRRLEEIAPEA